VHGRRRCGSCLARQLCPYILFDEESDQCGPVEDPDSVALRECLPLIGNAAARNHDPVGDIFACHHSRELTNNAWSQP